ncbi:CobW family GTP-binding protein [Paenibacillus sp. GCM10012306]|uniref:CobW family GTP-binding protein n=1 Tax=Paenibacillus sp. GCM10012306 TaxID=3317342 RepID=UPI00360C9818
MKIPVIILSGFLGSGKTTLLLSLLQESKQRGLNPGIVMNELGQRDVDGYILQEHTGMTVEKLLDGCICCSRKEELGESLQLLLARRPDAIFIELTGVANPEEIAHTLLETPLRDRLTLHYTATVLDAENTLEYNSRLSADRQLVRTLRQQIVAADLIIVNKSDLVEQETLWKIEKAVRKQNTEADIVYTHYSKINLAPLLAGITPREPRTPAPQRAPQTFKSASMTRVLPDTGGTALKEHDTAQESSYSQVAALTLTYPQGTPVQLARKQFEAFFRECGDSLLRAKGHVILSDDEPVQLVQYAGMRTTWEASSYPGLPYVVCIGLNLNESLLTERWSALFRS